MAFGARNENGVWRLCHRKGPTIHGTVLYDPYQDFQFSSQAKAKACADALNERYWSQYIRFYRQQEPPPFADEMVLLIREYTK